CDSFPPPVGPGDGDGPGLGAGGACPSESASAAPNVFPTPTLLFCTTTTRFSSGNVAFWFDWMKMGSTYRNESSIGITRKLPYTILDPCWPTSVRNCENVGSELIWLRICVGPSTFSPDGNSKLVTSP